MTDITKTINSNILEQQDSWKSVFILYLNTSSLGLISINRLLLPFLLVAIIDF